MFLFDLHIFRKKTPFEDVPPYLRHCELQFPMAFLSTGSLCNHNCRYCIAENRSTIDPIDGIHASASLLAGTYKKITINLIGGEPTIHPNFKEIIKRLRGHETVRTAISTNGITLADKNFTEWLVRDMGVKSFMISFDSHIPDRFNWFSRRGFTWDRVSEALRQILSIPETDVMFNTIVTRANVGDIPGTVDYIHQLEESSGKRLPIVFSALKLRGSATENKDELALSMSESAAAVRGALDRMNSMNMWGGCLHLTPCLMGDYAPALLNMYTEIIQGSREQGKIIFRRVKTEDTVMPGQCGECRYEKTCTGLYPEYLKIYGDSEFSPVR